jgi:hypothetical protein
MKNKSKKKKQKNRESVLFKSVLLFHFCRAKKKETTKERKKGRTKERKK